jgi:hypothetical protein
MIYPHVKLYISRYEKQISGIVIAVFNFLSFASYVIWASNFSMEKGHNRWWAGSLAVRGKITGSGVPDRLNNFVIFVVYT